MRAGCALIGGETAEHPGTMKPDDYDLAGFAVGVVDRDKILDKNKMQPGDVVIALPSSGLHSNGYSLVRKVFDVENADLGQYYGELGCELGEELLRPTKIYVRPVLAAVEAADVRGISHITGGGFYENIPRCIPDGLCAKIEKALHIPPIFPCSRAWAASRSAICSTPSTWARAWCSSLQETAPIRRSPRCILSVRKRASSVRSTSFSSQALRSSSAQNLQSSGRGAS